MKRTLRLTGVLLAILMVFSMAACGGSGTASSGGGSAEVPAGSADQSASGAEPAKTTDFPKKPIEIIVGFAAGGANHLAAENLKPEAQEIFGQPMSITCKPGASSAVANSYVAAASADGYTLLNATLSLPISLYTGVVDYKMEDFVGIAMYSDVTPCLVIRADLPVNTLEELITYANENPNSFSWGHSGVASTLHLSGCIMFDEMGIIDIIKEVPFTGTNEAVAQVLGGHIDAVVSFPSTVQEQVKAGNMRVLGVSATKRVEEFPDVPTFQEQGYNATLTSSRGIFARSDTPQEVLDVLEAGFKVIIESEDFKERAITLGEPPIFMNSKDFTALYYEQCETIQAVVEKLGLAETAAS